MYPSLLQCQKSQHYGILPLGKARSSYAIRTVASGPISHYYPCMYESVLQPTSFGTIPKNNFEQKKGLSLPSRDLGHTLVPIRWGSQLEWTVITRHPKGK